MHEMKQWKLTHGGEIYSVFPEFYFCINFDMILNLMLCSQLQPSGKKWIILVIKVAKESLADEREVAFQSTIWRNGLIQVLRSWDIDWVYA